jgi:hypothetical protein
MKSGAAHRSGIYLISQENLREFYLGDCLMKDVQPISASNGVPYVQMTGRITQGGRRKEDHASLLTCLGIT